MEPDEENATNFQERILVEMCTTVKQNNAHILSEDELALLDTILSLDADSLKLLYSMWGTVCVDESVAGNGRRYSFKCLPAVSLSMIWQPFVFFPN